MADTSIVQDTIHYTIATYIVVLDFVWMQSFVDTIYNQDNRAASLVEIVKG